MNNHQMKYAWLLAMLGAAGCSQASRSGAAGICGAAPLCFRTEGMITPQGATDAPGPYTVVADVVSDQAVAWTRVAFRRTRLGIVQAQEEFLLERTESGLFIGTLDGRSGDVLNYRLDTALSGSTDLVFWPGPDAEDRLTLQLLLPGETVDAGVQDGGMVDVSTSADVGDHVDGSVGDVSESPNDAATVQPLDGGVGPVPADSGLMDAG